MNALTWHIRCESVPGDGCIKIAMKPFERPA